MLPRRFDSQRLRAVLPAEVTARHCALSDALVRACRLGAGPATRPGLLPWAAPRIEWACGVLHVADAEAARRACLELDGSWRLLDAQGRAARWRVRLAAQWADAVWWRPLAVHDAWDAGVLRSLAALPDFRPRRATLLVVEPAAVDAAAAQWLARWEQAALRGPRAVRLVIAGGPCPPFARPVVASR